MSKPSTTLPPDDCSRNLVVASAERDASRPHLGVVGDTYTPLLSGQDTNGRYCLIDMFVPPGGGPGSHRHDFEETFVILEGEIVAAFRGEKRTVRAGESAHIPANAPHSFTNASGRPARLLCICSPAGQEEFFKHIGTQVSSRTSPPAPLDKAAQEAFLKKAEELAPRYRTELLKP